MIRNARLWRACDAFTPAPLAAAEHWQRPSRTASEPTRIDWMINASRRTPQHPVGFESRCRRKEQWTNEDGATSIHNRWGAWPASQSRAGLCPPFTGTRARPPAAFFQVPRAAYRAIAGPLHRCARPWSPCSGTRTCGPVVRTVRRLRQCPRGAMEAERIGHAVARRTSDAIAPRPSEDRMATGRRRLNHRSTSG